MVLTNKQQSETKQNKTAKQSKTKQRYKANKQSDTKQTNKADKMASVQTTCVGWRKLDDSSTWDAVVKTKQTKTTKTKKTQQTIAVESFNSTESYKTVWQKNHDERIRRKREQIQNQINQEAVDRKRRYQEKTQREIQAVYDQQRCNYEEKKQRASALWEKKYNQYKQNLDIEIQAAYDHVETMEFNWNTRVETHIQRVEDGKDMVEWVEHMNTIGEAQFWFDFMTEYNPEQLVDIEFESEKGWFTECPSCNWSIQKGMDDDYCRCAKTITF